MVCATCYDSMEAVQRGPYKDFKCPSCGHEVKHRHSPTGRGPQRGLPAATEEPDPNDDAFAYWTGGPLTEGPGDGYEDPFPDEDLDLEALAPHPHRAQTTTPALVTTPHGSRWQYFWESAFRRIRQLLHL